MGTKFFLQIDEVAMGGLIGRHGGLGTNAPDLKPHSGQMARVPTELFHGNALGSAKLDLTGSLSRWFRHSPRSSTVQGLTQSSWRSQANATVLVSHYKTQETSSLSPVVAAASENVHLSFVLNKPFLGHQSKTLPTMKIGNEPMSLISQFQRTQ